MSLLKTIRAQLGLSSTPANNFTLTAEADNGTMKLARGVAGATTQDVMTINALGEVDFPQMIRSIAGNGYLKLPSGLIIQWQVLGAIPANTSTAFTRGLAFPNFFLAETITAVGGSAGPIGSNGSNKTTISVRCESLPATSAFVIAIGY